MNNNIMSYLEEKGLIIRLLPSKEAHRLPVKKNEGKGGHLYKSDVIHGGHSLVNVAIDNNTFSSFGTHPDNEEFLLLGGINEKKLYLLIALLKNDEFQNKIDSGTLSSDDFVCLECVFNDPNLSFFVMLKDVPHGECALGEGRPTTFYVTEGSNLSLDIINMGNYEFCVVEG